MNTTPTTKGANMEKKLTDEFYICSICNISNQFEFFAVHEGSQYYVGTRCPRERCGHTNEFYATSYRVASEYLQSKAKN